MNEHSRPSLTREIPIPLRRLAANAPGTCCLHSFTHPFIHNIYRLSRVLSYALRVQPGSSFISWGLDGDKNEWLPAVASGGAPLWVVGQPSGFIWLSLKPGVSAGHPEVSLDRARTSDSSTGAGPFMQGNHQVAAGWPVTTWTQ